MDNTVPQKTLLSPRSVDSVKTSLVDRFKKRLKVKNIARKSTGDMKGSLKSIDSEIPR